MRPKPSDNGRLEVAWRIYDAICNIHTGDLTPVQREFVAAEQGAAYKRYELEGKLVNLDGLQGPMGAARGAKK
jgi:hypothetical protein